MDAGAGSSLFDQIARGLVGRTVDDDADHPDAARARDAQDGDDGVVIGRSRSWPAPDISTQIQRPSITERQCSRSGCSDAAAVTLSYHYGQSQVWIDYLSPEREPHMYDMCDRHAERLSVPQGWHLDDRRGVRRGALIAV
ncbi:DUF3499 family protein [Ilumatobacter nonamiensis]|uniref:DUF3499 family protein n=1 Tax=Ilumatobacter nonamiensis TaxID=467093 RepID=UPI00034DF928|nr:DUF3499 family protein [Ilumatobacter nonamiensis]